MIVSASLRKSISDLSRRRARTVFTVATLAFAVMSISFFAIPTLIDRAMQDEVRAGGLADVTLSLRPLELTAEQLARLAALPNVAAIEPRSSVDVRVLVGERRAPARVIGVRNFARQDVDLVRIESGALPGRGEVLADVQDANVGVYDGKAGDSVTVLGASGEDARFVVSGRGRSLPGGEQVQDENLIVLYASDDAVAALSGESGYGELALRLDDPRPPAAAETVEAVRRFLKTVPAFAGLSDLPDVRAPGDWPGKGETEKFAQLLSVITMLALLSALVLISNTMTTLVAEQTSEIGVMRAIGARRRQVALVYVRTALLLGALGALAGIGLGIMLSSLIAGYFGSVFWAIDVGFGIDPTVLAASLIVGLVAPPLAALPAIRRGLRTDLREALDSKGSAIGGQDAGDRLLRHAGFLPRTMQIGLRNMGRRKRRSVATALIVALAVANLLAVLGLAAGVSHATRQAWGDHLEDVQISTGGRALFDERAEQTIRSTPGVAEVEPVLKNTVELAGREAFVWGVEREPLLRYRLFEGRWFNAGDEQTRARVAVIERNIAQLVGVDVGDEVMLGTAAGDAAFRIVGIATNQQEDGTALYAPLTTVRTLLNRPAGASAYWVRTETREQPLVDRTTSRLEDRLAALGYETTSEIRYVAEREEIAANRSITTTIALLGFVIVAMSIAGLANAITTNVLERTREIGILRCIGARGRDVRRIFTTEGIALALAGWLLGIPLGFVVNRLFVLLVWEVVDVRVPAVFPPVNLLIALAGTVLLALLVLFLPVRRAVRFRPGDALRYA
jgi:putative ABC transport system permease protein